VTIHGMFGLPGAGKSYVLSAIGLKALRQDRLVFANFQLDGARLFHAEDLHDLPPSVVLLDEAQNFFHARNWRAFDSDLTDTWSQTRKSGWKVFLASQADASVDAEIRRRCQYQWWLQKCWSKVRDPFADEGEGRPLYVLGKQWFPEHYRKTGRDHRPVRVHRWWYRESVGASFDTLQRISKSEGPRPPVYLGPAPPRVVP